MILKCKETCEQGLPKKAAPEGSPTLRFDEGVDYDFGAVQSDDDGQFHHVVVNGIKYRVPLSIVNRVIALGYLEAK